MIRRGEDKTTREKRREKRENTGENREAREIPGQRERRRTENAENRADKSARRGAEERKVPEDSMQQRQEMPGHLHQQPTGSVYGNAMFVQRGNHSSRGMGMGGGGHGAAPYSSSRQ